MVICNMAKETRKLVAGNKKAFHEYFIEEKYEAGISLAGTEVKSLRMGKCSIKESFTLLLLFFNLTLIFFFNHTTVPLVALI